MKFEIDENLPEDLVNLLESENLEVKL